MHIPGLVFSRFVFASALTLATSSSAWVCKAETPPAVQGAAAATSRNAPATPPAQDVVLIGTPSLLRVANPWPGEQVEEICATFRIEAEASISAVDVYTTGLGNTLLAVTEDRSAPCPKQGALRITIKKGANSTIGTDIAVRIDSKPLSTPGTSIQGAVVAVAGTKKLAEFALKVERPPREEIWAAGLWTLGVIIPAALTFGFGQLVVWLTARQKEKNEFRDYRLANLTSLHDFFNTVDTVIRAAQQRPGETVYGLIVARGIFSKMTGRGIRLLSTACVSNDLPTIVTALARLFPEFEKPVTKLRQSLTDINKPAQN